MTLSVGPNDITGRGPVERYEKNLGEIFARLGRETGAVVVANLIPDLTVTPRYLLSSDRRTLAERTLAFNEALAREAKKHGVELVDIYTASREEVPRRPELVWRDGYHPSDLGYARWAELLWAGIERRIAAR